MLHWIYVALGRDFGPLRLFDSFFFLAAAGFATTALMVWTILPRLWNLLPRDMGRAFAVGAQWRHAGAHRRAPSRHGRQRAARRRARRQ